MPVNNRPARKVVRDLIQIIFLSNDKIAADAAKKLIALLDPLSVSLIGKDRLVVMPHTELHRYC